MLILEFLLLLLSIDEKLVSATLLHLLNQDLGNLSGVLGLPIFS